MAETIPTTNKHSQNAIDLKQRTQALESTHAVDQETVKELNQGREDNRNNTQNFRRGTDARWDAGCRLATLRQKRSASEYAVKFRQIASQLEWNDNPLKAYFYKGLKDSVKDALCTKDRPASLSDFIQQAVQIDDRLYERRQERKRSQNSNFV